MADKPKSSAPAAPSDDGHSIAFKLIGLVFFLILLGSVLNGLSFFNKDGNGNVDVMGGGLGEDFNWSALNPLNIFPSGTINLGESAASKRKLEVRIEPAGQILGYQKTGTVGRVMEGPIERFDIAWWRIDFKDAPDGWVNGKDLTSHVGWFRTLNFFPWLLSGLKQILILLGVISLVLWLIISAKRRGVAKLKKQKAALKKKQSHPLADNDAFADQPKKIGGDFDELATFPEDLPIMPEKDLVLPIPNLPIGQGPKTQNVSERRWKNIKMLSQSHNLNDWKQAIMEADIILDEMLEKMGYQGNSIGEKLKQIEASDFLTLNQAWEAHKVRNKIAHQGASYVLSRDEAEKVIKLYEEVFNEFYFI